MSPGGTWTETAPGWRGVLLLLGVIALGHGGSLFTGFFIDDWHHAEHFARLSWSLTDLWSGFRFDFGGDILPSWWAVQPVELHYCRPLTLALHKAAFAAMGMWAPGHHALSLSLHAVAALLAWRVAADWLGPDRPRAALLAAALWAVHPVTAVPVQWCAATAEPLAAVAALASLIALRRAQSPIGWLTCYAAAAAALLSRESAVMLPLVAVLLGRWAWPVSGRGPLVPWARLAPLFGLTVAYLAARTVALGGFPTPPTPYYTGPSDPSFAAHVAGKLLWNAAALSLAVPTAPLASDDLLVARPGLWWALSAAVLTVSVGLGWRLRAQPGVAVWAAWALLWSAPSLPMFVSPHYLYLPALGATMLLAAALGEADRRSRLIGGLLLAGAVAVCVVETMVLRGAAVPGQLVVADAAAAHAERPFPPGARLYFVNLSPLAHEALPAIRSELGRPDLRGWVLTMTPEFMGPRGDLRLRRVDAHTLEIAADPVYFSGRTGRVLLELGGRRTPLAKGDFVPSAGEARPFSVTVIDADADGVRAIRVRFDEPIDDPRQVLLVGGFERFAARVEPSRLPPGAELRDLGGPLREQRLPMRFFRKLRREYDRVGDNWEEQLGPAATDGSP